MAKRKAKKKERAKVLLPTFSGGNDWPETPAQRAVALGNRLEHLSDPTEARKILDKRKRKRG